MTITNTAGLADDTSQEPALAEQPATDEPDWAAISNTVSREDRAWMAWKLLD